MDRESQIFLWSLAGMRKTANVRPETHIEELTAMVNKDEFRDVRFLVGYEVLPNGTVEEIGLQNGAEVQVVVISNFAKAVAAIEIYFDYVKDLAHGHERTLLEEPDRLRNKCRRALMLLRKNEPCSSEISDKLVSIIRGWIFALTDLYWAPGITFFLNVGVASGMFKKGQVAEDLIALCETFGRTCENPIACGEQLLQAWSTSVERFVWYEFENVDIANFSTQSGVYFASFFCMVIFVEIDSRNAKALPMDSMARLVHVFVTLQKYDFQQRYFNPAFNHRKRLMRSTLMALKPSICTLISKFGGRPSWQIFAEVVAWRQANASDFAKKDACESLKLSEAVALASMANRFAAPPIAEGGIDKSGTYEPDPSLAADDMANLGLQTLDTAGVDSMDESSVALIKTLEMSEKEAQQLEQEDVVEALLRSKAEPLNGDGVQIVRLTFHSPRVKSYLLDSSLLKDCLDRVQAAGCEVAPSWANGALLLVPLSAEQVLEAQIELKAHNIVLLSADVAIVKEVLAGLPNRKRPAVKREYQADRVYDGALSSPTDASLGVGPFNPVVAPDASNPSNLITGFEMTQIEIVVERAFVHFPCRPFEISESSTVANSAPSAACTPAHPNPRRWGHM